jgi:hypothetical protein
MVPPNSPIRRHTTLRNTYGETPAESKSRIMHESIRNRRQGISAVAAGGRYEVSSNLAVTVPRMDRLVVVLPDLPGVTSSPWFSAYVGELQQMRLSVAVAAQSQRKGLQASGVYHASPHGTSSLRLIGHVHGPGDYTSGRHLRRIINRSLSVRGSYFGPIV